MAKFPQLDWVAINGRDTPFTKPQHYKEGSTSETDLTGHDNPLPTTDKNVRAELESIKATQDKILKRLDEPLDTQLTGSNVELIRDYSATVVNGGVHSAGDIFARGLDIPSLDVSGYKDITILIEALAESTTGSAVLRMFFTTDNKLRGT